MKYLLLLLLPFAGCINSHVQFSPTASLYNRGGTVGNPGEFGEGEQDSNQNPAAEGGGSLKADASLPSN
jgi:hypothetical protein